MAKVRYVPRHVRLSAYGDKHNKSINHIDMNQWFCVDKDRLFHANM